MNNENELPEIKQPIEVKKKGDNLFLSIIKLILGLVFLGSGFINLFNINNVSHNPGYLFGHVLGTIICFLIAYWGLRRNTIFK